MQEHHVTIAGETHAVPNPFVVMATQNPIETEGTYPLPEAQVDRFMMKVLVGLSRARTRSSSIVSRVTGAATAGCRQGGDDSPARSALQLRLRAVLYRRPQRSSSLVVQASWAPPATQRCVPVCQGPVGRFTSPMAPARAHPSTMIEGGQGAGVPPRPRLRAARRMSSIIVPDVLRHRLSLMSYEALSGVGVVRRHHRASVC